MVQAYLLGLHGSVAQALASQALQKLGMLNNASAQVIYYTLLQKGATLLGCFRVFSHHNVAHVGTISK